MSLTAYPTLRLKLTMPQALKLQFLPAIPGSNAAAAAAVALAAAQQAQTAADTAVAATANKVDRTGDVMSGFLTLNANPTAPLHAATKQYVDAQAGSGGIPDAPSDGTTYGRLNAAWAAVQPLDGDLTALAALTGTNTIYYRSAANTWSPVVVSTGLSFSGGTLSATATGVSDGDKGDITVTGSGATWTIDNDVVTYAKMQNVSATARFIGRVTAGAGDPEELTGTQATTLLNPFTSALQGVAPASGGGTANFLRADGTWATPASGGAPTGAEYVVAALDGTLTNERVLTNTATVIWDFTTPGQVKATATGGGGGSLPPDGTYTDIAVSGSGTIWTVRPAVITYSKIQNVSVTNRFLGRITAGAGSTEELTGANAKTIIGSGDLTKADDTNVTLTLGGTPAAALYSAVSLTLGWTGTLAVARGGLGVGTITGLMQGNGTGAVTGIANSSTVGQVLRVTGASTYAWGALDLASANATTGDLPFSALAQGSARSVLGVTANATADVASIQGTTDQVLRINGAGTALAFGAIDLSKTAAATGVIQAASFPTLTGDVTSVSGALATTIANDAVTYAKMQNVSAASLLIGRGDSGSGDPQEITLGTGLTMTGTTLAASASGGGFSTIAIQKFTTVGANTYTPTAGMKFCTIELVGGGGGGGASGDSTGGSTGLGGGGSGGYSRITVPAATIGVSKNVTIGAAGTAGVAGSSGNGGNGGQTFVGVNFATAICAANGGNGGIGQASASAWSGGAGGSVTGAVGDIIAAGEPGNSGSNTGSGSNTVGGNGGSSFFGGGGLGAAATSAAATAGGAASNYGSGGAGAVSGGTATKAAGGAGSAGFVIITEYI